MGIIFEIRCKITLFCRDMERKRKEKPFSGTFFSEIACDSHFFYIFGVELKQTEVMGNRKDLKLVINFVCDELLAECVAASLYNGTPDTHNVESLLLNILNVRDDFISRISHPEPGLPKQKFFKILKQDFNERVSEIIDQISNLN